MKNFKIIILILFISFLSVNSYAEWVWTPETNKWINPKYAVKETPFLQLEYAKEFFNKEDYSQAIKEFDKLIKNYPKAREAAEAQYYVGLSYEKLTKLVEAFKQYQVVIEKYPFAEKAAEVVQRQYNIGLQLLDKRANNQGIIDKITANDYDVIEIFRTVIKNAPYGEYASASQYKIGLYLFEKKLYKEAREEFDKVMNDYPESQWAKGAKYQIALVDAQRSTDAQYDQRITQSAVKELREFVSEFPDAELSNQAKKKIKKLREKEAQNAFLIASFYEKQKNYKAAKVYYKALVDKYGDTSYSAKALRKILEMNEKTK